MSTEASGQPTILNPCWLSEAINEADAPSSASDDPVELVFPNYFVWIYHWRHVMATNLSTNSIVTIQA